MADHLERIGQQVGDYRLLRWLGGGGFGNVYLAEQVQDHSQVAIKLLHIRLTRRKELKAFINEARTIRLKHAHIVPLLDFGISQEEIPFLVMEYVAQGTLHDRYREGSQVPLPLVVNYAQQIASALQYAHEQRLIHRDVKPGNMLLREDGTVLLSDFGLVTIAHSLSSQGPHQGIGGTAPYMAPEQIQGQARAASDQYSLGIVVYEWITGRQPFKGTVTEVAMQHAMKPPPSLVAQVPGLSRAVEEVVLKALAKDPKDRFATVQDFTGALEQVVREASAMLDVSNTAPVGNNERVLSSYKMLPIPSAHPGPRVDWGDAPEVSVFYGREEEQAQLIQWIVQERCCVVSVLGMGGIGKSVLSVNVMHKLVLGNGQAGGSGQAEESGQAQGRVPTGVEGCPFEVVIFRSLRDAPSCEVLIDECLQVLSVEELSVVPTTLEQRLSLLLSHFRKTRVLVVLDNMEVLLQEGDIRGQFRPGFEGYGQLLHRLVETAHQSCLLFTSREKPTELRSLKGSHSSVRSLRLAGLDTAACKLLLEEKGILGKEPEQEQLIQLYAGNPLALKIVAETIIDLFGSEINEFLAAGMLIFGSIADLLDEQFARLSALEQSVLCWLAISREPMTLDELLAAPVIPLSRIQMLEALDAGYRRSLIERGKRPSSFTLQSVVMEYVTAFLIAEASSEIQQYQLNRLIHHGLERAGAKEYVRQVQERLLLSPLLAQLQSVYLEQAEVEGQLLSLLDQLREEEDSAQGYGPANLMALLRLQRGHLSGLDLSRLSIRGAYLRSIQMQDTKLSGAKIRDTLFAEAVSATWAVVISLDGNWWAAGSLQGNVCIWKGVRSQTPHLIWQAHTGEVEALAFSPDGQTLASASLDGTVKLWDVGVLQGSRPGPNGPRGAPLWTGRQNVPISLAFSPDGSLLVSGGLDATVRLWEMGSHVAGSHGINLQTLTHSGPVFAVSWSPDGRLLVSGDFNGEIRVWERLQTVPTTCVEILSLQTSGVTSLAFAPDGGTLASTHWDQTVNLWEVESLPQLHHREKPNGRMGDTDQSRCVVWSPDGRVLAYSSSDKGIWFWDVGQDRYRAALRGHTAEVYGLTFTPDSSSLLSSSADGTLRVWDVQSRQCVHIIAGHEGFLCDIDWSPDGTKLISGGSDGLVTIWDLSGGMPARELRGHDWVVSGVGWSPDGKYLSSCGWDPVIRPYDSAVRLWDPASGVCVQKFDVPSVVLASIAWSPDGHLLACGTFAQGMQVWDVTARRLCWVGEPHQTVFHRVAWSPDGTWLAASSTDGIVYLWETPRRDPALGLSGQEPLSLGLPTKLMGHRGRVMGIAWSPDGTRLASSGGDVDRGELFVWDVQSGEGVQTFGSYSAIVSAVVWSQNWTGDLLVSGEGDGVLRWWDVGSGKCVDAQVAHQGIIQSLRVSHDGRRLASCGDDGAIGVWDMTSHEYLRTLRQDRPYERLNITGIRGLNEAQKESLRALGAIDETAL